MCTARNYPGPKVGVKAQKLGIKAMNYPKLPGPENFRPIPPLSAAKAQKLGIKAKPAIHKRATRKYPGPKKYGKFHLQDILLKFIL